MFNNSFQRPKVLPRLLLPVLVFLGALVSFPSWAQSAPNRYLLNVPYMNQGRTEWCWATSTAMVLTFYGHPVSPDQVVALIYGWPNPAFTGSLQQIQFALQRGGVPSQLGGPLSYQQIVAKISSGRPILVNYTGSFGGHVVVLFGYDVSHGSVFIHDPVYGPNFEVPYGVSFSYVSQGAPPLRWSYSIVPY